MGRTKTKHVLAEFSHLLAQVQLLGKNNFICCDCQHLSLFRAMAWMGRTTTHPQMWKQWKFKKRHAWQSAVKGKSVWAFRHVKTKKKKKRLLSKSSRAYGSGKLLMHFHHLGYHSGATKVFHLPTFDLWDFPHRHITDHTLRLWRHSDSHVQLLFITFTMSVSLLIQQ